MKTTFLESKNKGIIVRVAGMFVSVKFQSGRLPNVYNLREVTQNYYRPLIQKVRTCPNAKAVGAVSVGSTFDLQRGYAVEDTRAQYFPGAATCGRHSYVG